MLIPFEARYAQQVDAEIRTLQRKILDNLGTGAILRQGQDAATIGLLCAAEISKVVGLQEALKIMEGVHKEMTGSTKKAAKD